MSAVNPRSPVSGYRLVRELSAGAGSRVCLCSDEGYSGRRVALKVLPARLGEALAAHAIRAHRQLEALEHPNLPRVYKCGLLDDEDPERAEQAYEAGAFVAMEYLDGVELEEQILDGMSSAAALEVLIAVARGLGAAHEAGLVHGTLSPSHVLFRDDATPVLIGFGSVESVRGVGPAHRRYRSPELRAGQAPGTASDIWALGICFYDMLTGAEADEGDGRWPPPLPDHLSMFAPLIDAMTAEEPYDRVRSADQIVERAIGLREAALPRPATLSTASASTAPELLAPNETSVFDDQPPEPAPALGDVEDDLVAALAQDFADDGFLSGTVQRPESSAQDKPRLSPPTGGASVLKRHEIDEMAAGWFDGTGSGTDVPDAERSMARASVTEVDFDVGTAAPDGETGATGHGETSAQTLDIDLNEFVGAGKQPAALDVDLDRVFAKLDTRHVDTAHGGLADLAGHATNTRETRDEVGVRGRPVRFETDAAGGLSDSHFHFAGEGDGTSDAQTLGTGTLATDAARERLERTATATRGSAGYAGLSGTGSAFESYGPYQEEQPTQEFDEWAPDLAPPQHKKTTQDWFSRLTIGGLLVLLLGFGWAAYKGLIQDSTDRAAQLPSATTGERPQRDAAATSPARAFAGGSDSASTGEQASSDVARDTAAVAASSQSSGPAGATSTAPAQVTTRTGAGETGAFVVPPTDIQPLAPVATSPAIAGAQGTESPVVPVTNEPGAPDAAPEQAAGASVQAVAALDRPEVSRLLELGRQRLAENKLTTPEQQSAYRYYREAIELQPGSPGARALRQDIAARYVVLANARWSRSQYSSARSLARRGLSVDPDNAELAEILTRPLPGEEGSGETVSAGTAPEQSAGNARQSDPAFGSSLRRFLDRFQPVPPGQKAIPKGER